MNAALITFFNSLKGFFTAGTTWTIPNNGDSLDETTGALTGAWTGGTTTAVTGTASGSNYIAGAGARIVWTTNDIFARRRVKGATFLTGMNAIEFQVDGTPQATTVASVLTACNALITAMPLMAIWSRPVPVQPPTTPPTFSRLGASHIVLGGFLNDKASWLRSRRT